MVFLSPFRLRSRQALSGLIKKRIPRFYIGGLVKNPRLTAGASIVVAATLPGVYARRRIEQVSSRTGEQVKDRITLTIEVRTSKYVTVHAFHRLFSFALSGLGKNFRF